MSGGVSIVNAPFCGVTIPKFLILVLTNSLLLGSFSFICSYISQTDNISSFTAWANDTDYANVFAGQLSTFAKSADLVIAYSGSGNSANVLNGISAAKEAGCRTAAVTGDYNGGAGGELAGMVDVAIVVPTTSMERIEDMQLIINHIVKEATKANRGQ